jgi:hypothetical protein
VVWAPPPDNIEGLIQLYVDKKGKIYAEVAALAIVRYVDKGR